MSINYQISPVKSHFDPEDKVRYIARPTKRTIIGMKKISQMINQRTTASPADIMLVLYSFIDLIPELLMDNYIVHLKPFGIFSLSFKCKPEENPEDVSYNSISELRIQFRPDPEIKLQLREAKIRKAD